MYLHVWFAFGEARRGEKGGSFVSEDLRRLWEMRMKEIQRIMYYLIAVRSGGNEEFWALWIQELEIFTPFLPFREDWRKDGAMMAHSAALGTPEACWIKYSFSLRISSLRQADMLMLQRTVAKSHNKKLAQPADFPTFKSLEKCQNFLGGRKVCLRIFTSR